MWRVKQAKVLNNFVHFCCSARGGKLFNLYTAKSVYNN